MHCTEAFPVRKNGQLSVPANQAARNGRPTWRRFRELFDFGRDVFLTALGFQMLNASQTLILTRILGVELAATWSVCTRTFTFVTQLIYRIFQYSAPALAEMIVRGEKGLLWRYLSRILSGREYFWDNSRENASISKCHCSDNLKFPLFLQFWEL